MVWGLFPGVYKNVSWESHMLGSFSGAILAVLYRKEGPQKPVYDWMEEDDDTEGYVGENESEEMGDLETKGQRDEETKKFTRDG